MLLSRVSKLNVFVIGLLFIGCASFEPGLRFQDLARTRQPTVREVRDGMEVSVEEFVSTHKSNQAFDADIAPYGVLPLLVRVENSGTETYRVQEKDITVFLDNQPLGSLSGEEAASQAGTSEYAGKALAWTVATGPFFILLWPATIGGSAAHTHSVNRRIQQHFESLRFNDALLKPNQNAVGFLYFKIPDGVKRLEKLSVQIEPSEEKSAKKLSFKLSLPPLELSAPASTPVREATETK